jgi:hypothetical protein
MTALTKYERLEATGLWRPSPEAQRVDVVACIGEATLTIKDPNDKALAHWSLAAIARANPGKRPAIFHPDGDETETLELAAEEDEMIHAIEKLRKAVERGRPHRGRLRGVLTAAVLLGAGLLGWQVLPGALVDQAIKVVPDVKRAEIGNALLTALTRVSGPPCRATVAREPLVALASRLEDERGPSYLAVLRSGVAEATHLPGGVILLNRTLVEDFDTPDVIAGYILAEQQRRHDRDPLRHVLESAGSIATARLLTSGSLPADAITAHAAQLLTEAASDVAVQPLLQRFANASVPSTPYAYALDVSGERSFQLIEGDPFRTSAPRPVLDDSTWVRLQTICD